MAKNQAVKTNLHPRNKHRLGYDFDQLTAVLPALSAFIVTTPKQTQSIDYANPTAVKCLNQALLKLHYNIDFWDLPDSFLCPPIPGRVDYIHYLADLIQQGETVDKINVVDIGTGASCIYPLLGAAEYGWHFTASDIDPISVKSSKMIVKSNRSVSKKIKVKHQQNANAMFETILNPNTYYAATLCNPPFHKSLSDAQKGSQRKVKNLTGKQTSQAALNFGGQKAELWCEGGEVKFIRNMINESQQFKDQVGWFTTLVSKKESLAPLIQLLSKTQVKAHRIIDMAQGQKVSRMLCWTFG